MLFSQTRLPSYYQPLPLTHIVTRLLPSYKLQTCQLVIIVIPLASPYCFHQAFNLFSFHQAFSLFISAKPLNSSLSYQKPKQRAQKSKSLSVPGPKGRRDHQLDMVGKSQWLTLLMSQKLLMIQIAIRKTAVTTTPAPSSQGSKPSKHSCAIRGTPPELHRPARSIRLAGGQDPWIGALSTPGIDENGAMKGHLMKMTMITADVAGRGGTYDLNNCDMLMMRADASRSGGPVNADASEPRSLPIPAFHHRLVSMIVSVTVVPSLQVNRNHIVIRMSSIGH